MRRISFVLSLLSLLFVSATHAQDSITTQSRVSVSTITIPVIYRQMASLQRLAPEIVYSIALTESGRSLDGKAFRPWPWTLNVESEAHIYSSQREMCEALQEFAKRGMDQIDVGLMQINMKVHSTRFANLDAACNPYLNLQVGIQILKESIVEKKSVWAGVGRYHSGTPELAQAYQGRVAKNLANHVLSRGAQ